MKYKILFSFFHQLSERFLLSWIYLIQKAVSFCCLVFLFSFSGFAQDSTPGKSALGDGLNFSLNEDNFQFKISGFVQPSYQYYKLDKQKVENNFRTKRTYLNFGGKALREKVSFFVQADFSAPTPLLDAWAAYHFNSKWEVSVGQRRTFTNNREMTFDEDKLQFSDRGMLSTGFSGTGREFGIFVQGKIGKTFVMMPQLAITSGDGANSFGTNSLDVDLGGLKYGGRLDIMPLGEFSEGNTGFSADLKHEENPKILVGVAGSFNQGVSSAKGEGHADFIFYDANKTRNLPDYRKLSADILVKFKGFSLMAEWMNASASHLKGIYLDSITPINTSKILAPGQISQFLVLGNAWNAQLGYVSKNGYAIDVRYENMSPEFSDQAFSQLQQAKVSTLGLGKYFNGHKLKLQATVSQVEFANSGKAMRGELLMQVVF